MDLFDNLQPEEPEPIPAKQARQDIDRLIADTRLYGSSKACMELLDFVSRLRNIAPFNAMLLHVQKPGITHVATIRDWARRFGRRPKRHARPLVVMRVFGPVDFVYDILDTEGRDVPANAFEFPTSGLVSTSVIQEFRKKLGSVDIEVEFVDEGDAHAGYIQLVQRRAAEEKRNAYRLAVNWNHPPATQFVTFAHEVAHMVLGHLGSDPKRNNIKDRRDRSHALMEIEAETVAYLVSRRSGVAPRSEKYLDGYQGSFDELDFHTILKAAGAVESLLGLPLGKDKW